MSAQVDVLIYQADGSIATGLDYATRIEERLQGFGFTTARYDLTRPPTADAFTGVRAHLFTGGETSVNSSERWMQAAIGKARTLIDGTSERDYSVLGICLGAQIIAEAVRPASIVSAEAIEVGLATVSWTGSTDVQQVVPEFHYQAISPEIESVPGVRVEWSNEHTRVQAFRYGNRVFGCQFHPELSADDTHNLIDHNQKVITEWGGDAQTAHRSVQRHADDLSDHLFRRVIIDRILTEPPLGPRLGWGAPPGFHAFRPRPTPGETEPAPA